MVPLNRSTPALFLVFGLLLLGTSLVMKLDDGMTGQVPMMVQEERSPLPVTNRCVGDGLQVCRCYCRAEFRQCQNDQVSYSSLPLCKVPWSNSNCAALSYFQTQAANATSCSAQNGQPCGGYIRPGDAPDALNQPVAGALLGCEIVAVPTPPSR